MAKHLPDGGHLVLPDSMKDKLATPDLFITKTTMAGLASIILMHDPVVDTNDMKIEARDTASQEAEESLH